MLPFSQSPHFSAVHSLVAILVPHRVWLSAQFLPVFIPMHGGRWMRPTLWPASHMKGSMDHSSWRPRMRCREQGRTGGSELNDLNEGLQLIKLGGVKKGKAF